MAKIDHTRCRAYGLTMLIPMPMLAAILDGWELVLVLSVVLILFGAKHLPGLACGLRQFRKASDDIAHEAGESLGGIYGKPAAEALTPDNQTAELCDPAAFHREKRKDRAMKRTRSSPLPCCGMAALMPAAGI